jgi:2-hydroxychromene-2-carboxylate isomerase
MAIEFWFEFASTYSYPAAMRIEALAADYQVPIVWRPFLLGPIFAAQGWGDSPFNLYPAKGRYMWRDLERICAKQDLPLRPPSAFPRSGLVAARVAVLGADEPWLPAFVRAIYAANFAEDRNIADPTVVIDVLDRLGLSGAKLLAASTATDVKARLRAQTEAAAARGLFGAPSFVVGDELFWGNDRLEDALAWQR